jgi:hypothetical protein
MFITGAILIASLREIDSEFEIADSFLNLIFEQNFNKVTLNGIETCK